MPHFKLEMHHFKFEEFGCNHCGENHMEEEFLLMIDYARNVAGTPFTITSGYRCQEHNANVGGVPSSPHTRGWAADIACDSSSKRFAIINGLIEAGFTRIGIADKFVHVDCDPNKAEEVIWTYGR
jgi:zinc D-Ala-D-Ala carboxypeptidase